MRVRRVRPVRDVRKRKPVSRCSQVRTARKSSLPPIIPCLRVPLCRSPPRPVSTIFFLFHTAFWRALSIRFGPYSSLRHKRMLASPLRPGPSFSPQRSDEGPSYRPVKDNEAFRKLLSPVEFIEGSSSGVLAIPEGKYQAINESPSVTKEEVRPFASSRFLQFLISSYALFLLLFFSRNLLVSHHYHHQRPPLPPPSHQNSPLHRHRLQFHLKQTSHPPIHTLYTQAPSTPIGRRMLPP